MTRGHGGTRLRCLREVPGLLYRQCVHLLSWTRHDAFTGGLPVSISLFLFHSCPCMAFVFFRVCQFLTLSFLVTPTMILSIGLSVTLRFLSKFLVVAKVPEYDAEFPKTPPKKLCSSQTAAAFN